MSASGVAAGMSAPGEAGEAGGGGMAGVPAALSGAGGGSEAPGMGTFTGSVGSPADGEGSAVGILFGDAGGGGGGGGGGDVIVSGVAGGGVPAGGFVTGAVGAWSDGRLTEGDGSGVVSGVGSADGSGDGSGDDVSSTDTGGVGGEVGGEVGVSGVAGVGVSGGLVTGIIVSGTVGATLDGSLVIGMNVTGSSEDGLAVELGSTSGVVAGTVVSGSVGRTVDGSSVTGMNVIGSSEDGLAVELGSTSEVGSGSMLVLEPELVRLVEVEDDVLDSVVVSELELGVLVDSVDDVLVGSVEDVDDGPTDDALVGSTKDVLDISVEVLVASAVNVLVGSGKDVVVGSDDVALDTTTVARQSATDTNPVVHSTSLFLLSPLRKMVVNVMHSTVSDRQGSDVLVGGSVVKSEVDVDDKEGWQLAAVITSSVHSTRSARFFLVPGETKVTVLHVVTVSRHGSGSAVGVTVGGGVVGVGKQLSAVTNVVLQLTISSRFAYLALGIIVVSQDTNDERQGSGTSVGSTLKTDVGKQLSAVMVSVRHGRPLRGEGHMSLVEKQGSGSGSGVGSGVGRQRSAVNVSVVHGTPGVGHITRVVKHGSTSGSKVGTGSGSGVGRQLGSVRVMV